MANQYPYALDGALLVGGGSGATQATTPAASASTNLGNLFANPAFYIVLIVVFTILYFAWASSSKTKYYPGRRYY